MEHREYECPCRTRTRELLSERTTLIVTGEMASTIDHAACFGSRAEIPGSVLGHR